MTEYGDYNLAAQLRNAVDGQSTVFDIAREAGVGDEPGKVKVELSHLVHTPVRRESRKRSHALQSAQAVVDYVEKYGGSNTVVFIDASDHRQVTAVLDETAPLGREEVSFSADLHPRLKSWMEVALAPPMKAKAFAAFLARHRGDLLDMDGIGMGVALTFRQIRLAKEVEAQFGTGKTGTNGVMVKHKITGQAGEVVELPDQISLTVPMFVGGYKRPLKADLLYDGSGDDVQITVVLPTLDDDIREAFQAMANLVRDQVADETLVIDGSPYTTAWDYITG